MANGTKRNTYASSMQGVFLVAAELAKRGYIVSPTSRNAFGADLLIADPECKKSFTVQVKSQKGNPNFFLVGEKAQTVIADNHVYALVNLNGGNSKYFIVPSKELAKGVYANKKDQWHSFNRN